MLGELLIKIIIDKEIPDFFKYNCLNIAISVAPRNMFDLAINLIKNGDEIKKDLSLRLILNIWAKHAKSNVDIDNFDYVNLIKKYFPEVLKPQYPGMFIIHTALQERYPFEYPKSKYFLTKLGIFKTYGYTFMDPRCFEDMNLLDEFSYSGIFFSALTKHLELKYKRIWIELISPNQLSLLKNGILATYGYKIKNDKIRSRFNNYLKDFCRNGKCEIITNDFSESNLNIVDKHNIELIKSLEADKDKIMMKIEYKRNKKIKPNKEFSNVSSSGDYENVVKLLKKGISKYDRNRALIGAALNGHKDIVILLLQNGADINAKTEDYGESALSRAIQYSHTEIVNLVRFAHNWNNGMLE